jgi:ribosomal protein S1
MTESHQKTPSPDPLDAALSAEIEAALDGHSIEDLINPPTVGSGNRQSMTGTIVHLRGEEVYVEFGPKTQGVCPISHFDEKPTAGKQYDFKVVRQDSDDGMLILSHKGGVQKAQWESLEVGQVIEARCTGTNNGGLDMEVCNHKAFMPASHASTRHIEDLSILIGEKMPVEVIDLDRARGRIVLSHRVVEQRDRNEAAASLVGTLSVGSEYEATITSVKEFGAFADIGGLEGLIHVSDLSWQHVKNPADVVSPGQQVRVVLLKMDDTQQPPRVSLGMKQLENDPFTASTSTLAEGESVTGKVTRVTEFGAFVEIAPGVEGLVHISQLSHERVHRVTQVVKVGEEVTAQVLSVDHGQRRIALSMKGASSEGTEERKDDAQMRRLMNRFGDGPSLKGGIE